MIDKIFLFPYWLALKARHFMYDHGMKKSGSAAKEMRREIAQLKAEVNSSKTSALHLLELEKKVQELDDLQQTVKSLRKTVDAIPEEILDTYRTNESKGKGGHSRE